MARFEVYLPGGKSHDEWTEWHSAILDLGGKSPDWGEIQNIAIVYSDMTAEGLKATILGRMKNEGGLTVEAA